MDDYYTNLDDDSGYGTDLNDTGYYSDNTPNSSTNDISGVSTMFTVSYFKYKTILIIVFSFMPIIVFFFSADLIRGLLQNGVNSAAYSFVFTLVFVFLLFLFIFLEGPGKKVDVYGNGISIRKWFIFHENITVKDVQKCEVITNITVHTRYGSRTYNKLVLYYNNGHIVSFTDDVYQNWSKLVAYMAWNEKNVHKDGTSRLTKKLAGWIDKQIKK